MFPDVFHFKGELLTSFIYLVVRLWQTQQLLRPSLLRPEVLCLSFLKSSSLQRLCFSLNGRFGVMCCELCGCAQCSVYGWKAAN